MIEPLSRCPFCAVAYESGCLQSLLVKNIREIVHAFCPHCHRAMLFAIERRPERMSCIGLFTDCDAEDARRFLKKPKISLDDVLRIHELLSEKRV